MRKLTCILALAVTAAAHPSLAQDATPPDAPRTTTLDRVVVTAGEEKIAIETPQSVTVIDQEDLESAQYRMGSFFSDPELYKKVEVLRGPASSTLYGSGALAGVISLTTKDASDFLRPNETVTFREKLEFNDNRGGFLTSSILAAEPVKNLELLGSFNYRRSDNFRHGGGDIISGSAFAAPSGLVKAKYSFGMDKAHAARLSYQHWTTEASGIQPGSVRQFRNLRACDLRL